MSDLRSTWSAPWLALWPRPASASPRWSCGGHGAGAAVVAAAARPEIVEGLVLVEPFVRDPSSINPVIRGLFRLMMQPPWIRPVWKAWLPGLHAGRRPDDFDEHQAAVLAALARPGHRRALARTTRTSHEPAAAVISAVSAPALVVMGAPTWSLRRSWRSPSGSSRSPPGWPTSTAWTP